ncbi:MAG TPA: hypothetical protein PK836_09045 [Syntrophales bacterium]|nr:hypothetical protein [Syntrophales bacterium]HOM07800.1 hypothetical protein [Syntrophales bacterium]HOO00478.1 hypothetical protein [Syntrophales bacterium]HPC01811.1 hypothetical protein [Syntrophales bacterium]HPQ07292.1 hypothetical protein [Syntrophales bacterium]
MVRDEEEKAPCVGCGYCCCRNPCVFGVVRHGSGDFPVCPELFWNGRRYECRLMAGGGGESAFYRRELEAGRGCRTPNPWRRDVRERGIEEQTAVRDGVPWPAGAGRDGTGL